MSVTITNTARGKFVIGDPGALTVFDTQVTEITLEPSISKDDPREVLSGDSVPGDRTETWTIKGKLLSDFGADDSRVEFCFTNRGKQLPFRYTPSNASGKEFTGTLVVEPVAIGGEVPKAGEPDFEFSLVGAPTLGAMASTEEPTE